MTIVIRDFRDDDGPGVLEVHTGAIFATSDDYYTLAERQSWAHGLVAENYARVRDAGETFIVATTSDDIVVGFCSWTEQQVAGLYVAPAYQGQGIGGQLLDIGEAALRANRVRVSRIHASLSAIPFYRAHGYAVTQRGSHRSRGGLMMADAHLEKAIAHE
jgi:putative acetyltransferase